MKRCRKPPTSIISTSTINFFRNSSNCQISLIIIFREAAFSSIHYLFAHQLSYKLPRSGAVLLVSPTVFLKTFFLSLSFNISKDRRISNTTITISVLAQSKSAAFGCSIAEAIVPARISSVIVDAYSNDAQFYLVLNACCGFIIDAKF